MPRDFYDLLGVNEEVASDELKAAYRARARDFHPDVNADDRANAQFKTVRKAYEVLSDETERAAYDRMGHERYIRKRMKGLPTADLDARPRKASRWSRGGAAGRRRGGAGADQGADGGSTADAGADADADAGGAAGAAAGSGASERASASTASAATSRSSTASRRTAPGEAATAGGSAAARSHRRPGRTERRSSPLAAALTGALAACALYLAGLAQYVRADPGRASALADALVSDPVGAATATRGLGSPAEFAAAALGSGSLDLLFPAGAVLLTAAFAGVVARFGRGTAWLYAAAAAAPSVGLLAWAALPPSSSPTVGLALLVFVALPVGATLAFALDVGRYLRAA